MIPLSTPDTVKTMRPFSSIPAAALAAALALLGTATPLTAPVAHADDTDLYVDPNAASIAGLPHVMFDIDYRTNLGNVVCTNYTLASCDAAEYFRGIILSDPDKYKSLQTYIDTYLAAGTGKMSTFDVLKMALTTVFLEFEDFKGGLMVPHANINNCAGPTKEVAGCSNGAYILTGFNEMDETGRQKFLEEKLYKMVDAGGTLNHTYQLKEILFEFYRYVKGYDVYNGKNGFMDWGTSGNPGKNFNVGSGSDTDNNNHLLGYDETILEPSKKTYISPFASADKCTKMFFIHFVFGVTSQEDDSDAAIKANTDSINQGMGLTTLQTGTNGAIQMVSYMKNNDLGSTTDGLQTVTQYFVTNASSTSITKLAAAGGTTPVVLDPDDPSIVVDALRNILREILAVSTTFVAASVPVNVFNRSESLDNVFIALFQVDDALKPFWIGNMKKLKFGVSKVDGKTRELQDANGNEAIDAASGRIKFGALTYWTKDEALPAAEAGTDEVDGADGRVVDRGAAGQKLPGFLTGGPQLENGKGGREVFYDPATVLNDGLGAVQNLEPLDATDLTAAAVLTDLGAADVATAKEYIKYVRGLDTQDEDGDGVVDEAREWIFGDPLHSRPLPINYGIHSSHTKDNPLIYVAIGSNDGTMRFVRNSIAAGNTAADNEDDDAGAEAWAFMPRVVMEKVPELYKNAAASTHPYLVDGAPASYTLDINGDGSVNGSDRVYLFFGLRRGGRALYGLDVTDPTTPKIAWRIRHVLDSGLTNPDFEELGYTFAQPKVGLVNVDLDGDGKASDPVLFMTGGYDPNKDERAASKDSAFEGSDDSMGNAFFVIDAKTGELVWKSVKGTTGSISASEYGHAEMKDSIPAEPAILDSNGDGFVDRAVVGDSGGRVWRFDFSGATSNWRTSLIADLGRHVTGASDADDRRFLHRPDVVPTRSSTGAKFDAIVIGSGDRENPLDRADAAGSIRTDRVANYMYMIKDLQTTPYTSSTPLSEPAVIYADTLSDVSASSCIKTSCATATDDGWKMSLALAGEKSLSAPLTLVNTVFFTTYLPTTASSDPATCGPSEGSGLFYAVNLADATVSKNFNIARDSQDASTNTTRYTILSSAGIPADVVGVTLDGQAYVLPPDLKLSKVDASTRWRTFWYEVGSDDD